MPKKSASYELALPLRVPATPAYQWLYESIRAAILSGSLRPGARLPATRDLARQYALSRGTIVTAFDQLASEGYLQGTVGSGTFVTRTLPDSLLDVTLQPHATSAPKNQRCISVSHYARRARLFSGYEDRPTRAFRSNLPALDLFPTDLWTKIATRRLRKISRRDLMGCDPLGHFPLRQAVSDYLNRSRGVRCVPEQLAILSGVQEAIDLAAKLILDPGDFACVEQPGYPGASLAFQASGARLHPIQVTRHGLDLRHLPARGVRLIYITPAHQFPLGTTMDLATRLQLLQWAKNSGALIFEDDYDSEFRYSGRPIPALQGLDEHGSVLFAGSFSKVLFPALRLGYLVLPQSLVPHFEAALSLTVRHTSLLEQLVVNDFIRDGHFGRHLRRMREIYADRLSVLLEEARAHLAGLLEISGVEAGLQTTGWLLQNISAESAAAAAAKRNVDVTPLSRYGHVRGLPEGLQLGFAAVDKKEIRRGVRDLAIALQSCAGTVQKSGG